MKDISLYVPCFNAEKTIGTCLDAVFKQSYPIREVVVVDDGSTDKTVEAASQYPVRILKHPGNEGLARARNTALQNIDSEYIASLDSDCKPNEDWLARLAEHLVSDDIGGCGGSLVEFYRDEVCDAWRSIHMRQSWNAQQKNPPFLFGSNCVFSKRALLTVRGYDNRYTSNYEDVDISNKLKSAGYSLVFDPQATVYHLKRDNLQSLLRNFWNWNSFFYQGKGFYATSESFKMKIKDNIGLANRFIDEDIKSGNPEILYVDFLLAFHHSFKDYIFFTFEQPSDASVVSGNDALSAWLALVDLTLFYHLDAASDTLRTLMPAGSRFAQNLFALNLLVADSLRDKIGSSDCKKRIHADIVASISGISDRVLLDKIYDLTVLHGDWSDFIRKKHAHIDTGFLSTLSVSFREWSSMLVSHYPDIFHTIEESSRKVMPY